MSTQMFDPISFCEQARISILSGENAGSHDIQMTKLMQSKLYEFDDEIKEWTGKLSEHRNNRDRLGNLEQSTDVQDSLEVIGKEISLCEAISNRIWGRI